MVSTVILHAWVGPSLGLDRYAEHGVILIDHFQDVIVRTAHGSTCERAWPPLILSSEIELLRLNIEHQAHLLLNRLRLVIDDPGG